MDFARQFFVTTLVNKKWPVRLIEAFTVGVFNAARLWKQFQNISQDSFCSSEQNKLFLAL